MEKDKGKQGKGDGDGKGQRENKEKETAMETVNGIIPQGWVLELYAEVRHPTTRMRGNLIRNIETGRYAMLEGQTICSVPQEWARRQIAK